MTDKEFEKWLEVDGLTRLQIKKIKQRIKFILIYLPKTDERKRPMVYKTK